MSSVLVVSDTCARDASKDSVGPALAELLGGVLGKPPGLSYVPDEPKRIREAVLALAKEKRLVVTSGGTGLSKRDITPETVRPLFTKEAPGLATSMLVYGLSKTPLAALGRPLSGFIDECMVLCVPGSRNGALDSLKAVESVLSHAIDVRDNGRQAHEGAPSGAPQASTPAKKCNHHHNHSGPVFYGVANRPRSSPYPMIPFEQAQRIVFDAALPPRDCRVKLHECTGYVIAEDVYSPLNVPPFRASVVDGYAVLHSDCPGTFPVAEVSYAASDIVEFHRHSCVRITTGAPVPHGATAVVPVENTELAKQRDGVELEITITAEKVGSGDNIRNIGSDLGLGALVLGTGTLVSVVGGEVGLLASIGIETVKCWRKPVVGVLSTGDELVDAGMPCQGSQIWDSNRPMLIAALKAHGYEVVDLGIALDKPQDLSDKLRASLARCDVLVTSGGVSMGELDLLKPTIEKMGGTLHFGRVAMKPGKPVTFATLEGKAVFALPGNPASVSVCLHLFVLPFLHKSSGRTDYEPLRMPIKIDFAAQLDPRPEFHRVHARPTIDGWVASTTGVQRSSRIKSMAQANALLCLPAGLPAGDSVLPAGSQVEAILLQ